MRRWGEIGWLVCLAGLPLACFLDQRLDAWHGQTHWMVAWIGVLWLWSCQTSGRLFSLPRPLLAWSLWTWGHFWWGWHQTIVLQHLYPVTTLMALGHALCLLLFIHAALHTWTPTFLEELLRWLARTSVVLMIYSLLQWMQLDPFIKNYDPHQYYPGLHNLLVGTMGNPNHLGAYLAFSLPLIGFQVVSTQAMRWKWLLGLNLLLLGQLVIGYHSIGGFVAASTAGLWWSWRSSRKMAFMLGALLLAMSLWVWKFMPTLLTDSGRLTAWRAFYAMAGNHPVAGIGIGEMRFLTQGLREGILKGWGHCHNEYLQVFIEQGLMGIALVGWVVMAVIRRVRQLPSTLLVTTLSSLGVAFLVNSLYNFPAHLWVLASFGLVAYCGLYIVEPVHGT